MNEYEPQVISAALTEAAEDAEKVARLKATPFNACTNAELSYLRYHDLRHESYETVRAVANWLHGRAVLVGSPIPTSSSSETDRG